ncbi:MAG: CopG family transcriptional regulator [Deltaproteobacteria bacterium]|nr:CopG family transcriptional regulator [Deltaproteobacteria bacterium]
MVHLRNNGFQVDRKFLSARDLLNFKEKQRIPEKLQSCHTGLIDGYIIEGHVPADLIDKLLKEKPAVLGLAVPGMPIGSPGMEAGKPEPYNVMTFDKDGKTTVYAKR